MGSSKHRRLVTRRNPASSATCTESSPAIAIERETSDSKESRSLLSCWLICCMLLCFLWPGSHASTGAERGANFERHIRPSERLYVHSLQLFWNFTNSHGRMEKWPSAPQVSSASLASICAIGKLFCCSFLSCIALRTTCSLLAESSAIEM